MAVRYMSLRKTRAVHFIWNLLGCFECILKVTSIFETRCALHRALDRATAKERLRMRGRRKEGGVQSMHTMQEKEPTSSSV